MCDEASKVVGVGQKPFPKLSSSKDEGSKVIDERLITWLSEAVESRYKLMGHFLKCLFLLEFLDAAPVGLGLACPPPVDVAVVVVVVVAAPAGLGLACPPSVAAAVVVVVVVAAPA